MNPHGNLALSLFPPLIKTVSGNNTAASIDEGLGGINPHCISLHSFLPMCRTMTGIVGDVSGATLKRGVYFGRSRSRFQRTRMSLNSNVAVNRPHISGCHSPAFADSQGAYQSTPCTTLRDPPRLLLCYQRSCP